MNTAKFAAVLIAGAAVGFVVFNEQDSERPLLRMGDTVNIRNSGMVVPVKIHRIGTDEDLVETTGEKNAHNTDVWVIHHKGVKYFCITK